MVALVRQFGVEAEVVVGPRQACAYADSHTERAQIDVFVVFRFAGVVAVVVVVIAAVVTVVIAVNQVVIVFAEAFAVACLYGVIDTYRQRVRSFAAQPWLVERDAVVLVVDAVGLCAYAQGLSFALRHYFVHLFFEKVLNGEVGKFECQREHNARLSVAG